MATLRIDSKSPFYFACWRHEGKQRNKSTKIRHTPERSKRETKAGLMARAQLVSDAFEAADKEGSEHKYVKAAIEVLANDTPAAHVPSVKEYAEEWLNVRATEGVRAISSEKKALTLLSAILGARVEAPITSVTKSDAMQFVSAQAA